MCVIKYCSDCVFWERSGAVWPCRDCIDVEEMPYWEAEQQELKRNMTKKDDMKTEGIKMEHRHLNHSELISILAKYIPWERDQDYSFDVNTAKDSVCITVNRFNRFPVLEE